MRYLPHTDEEIAEMLQAIGLGSLDELFESIPERVRCREPLELEPPLDELALSRHVEQLAAANRGAQMLSFLGAGAYQHHVARAVDQLLLRGELFTAYTPYQPEVSQGTLQVIFEFQTIVSELLGLPVANASMYDASTAAAEAVLMARRLTRRDRTVVSGCVHPQYVETIRTYTKQLDDEVQGELLVSVSPLADGTTDVASLTRALDDQTACVIVGYPSFLGTVVDLQPLAHAAHDCGALLVTATAEPYALAVVQPPGAFGVDIAVAEGQPLALPLQYGGPGLGLFAARDSRKFLQQMPGRLCGETVDHQGKRGYVLTLATREQHIRRERATSNICTNSGLCAAAATINMCLLGKQGFIHAAELCLAKAEYLKKAITALDGYDLVSAGPTFNEFLVSVRGSDAGRLVAALADQDIVAGFDVGRIDPRRQSQLLVAVSECHERAQLDRFVEALAHFQPA